MGSRLLSRKRWIFGSCLGWPQWEVDWDKGLEIWSLVSILGMSLDLNMWVFRALRKKIGPKNGQDLYTKHHLVSSAMFHFKDYKRKK